MAKLTSPNNVDGTLDVAEHPVLVYCALESEVALDWSHGLAVNQ